MPFEFVENPEKTLSATTLRKYKNCLNKLSDEGFVNKQELLNKPKEVVDKINSLAVDKSEAMYFYSAVFYSIGREDFIKSPPHAFYYNEFNKYKTAGAKVVKDGKIKKVSKKKILDNILKVQEQFNKE
jgi:hypothetical protein